MKSFLFFFHRNKKSFKKIKVFSVVVLLLFSFSLSLAPIGVKEVGAQGMVVTDMTKLIWDKIQKVSKDLLKKADKAFNKAATIAFQRTLATALNKVAYDAANYVGSGNDGRKKLFQDLDLGTYLSKVGDEAAGNFLETFAKNINAKPGESCNDKYNSCSKDCDDSFSYLDADLNYIFKDGYEVCTKQCITAVESCNKNPNAASNKDMGTNVNSFNICQPSSIEVKLKIGLGLAEQNRPSAPTCTATKMISNWGDDINKKMADIKSGDYLKNIGDYFNPQSNDLSILFDVNTDLETEKKEKTELEKGKTLASNGWLDVRNISGTLKGTPGEAQTALNEARELRMKNFGKTTGDILVDASNIFLNQLAVSAFSTLMRKINNKTQEAGESLVNKDADPNSPTKYGVSSMKEKTMVILESKFENDRELDILSELSVCINPANPSPNNCVIDDRFMQAIIEQKTVAEAIEGGNLNSNWRVEKDVFASAYNNHYSLRNIKILRKHRILPTAWEVAIERAFENKANPRYATLGDLVSCFSQNDSYDDFSSKFDISDTLWCEGLIDPNWVLKAPLSYCKQAGYGSYISSMAFMEGIEVPGADRTPSSLMLIRDDNYCADNQSCIKENREGGCDAYGYCTEDRRTWSFASDSCSPLSNTCQTFTNVIDGTTASYLENTIDYSDCSSDSAGCRRYSLSGKYSTSSSISWDFSKNLFFNKNLSACDQKNEGCSELIRVKPTWGSNLVFDSGFNLIEENKIFTAGQKLGAWDIYSSGPNSSATVIDSFSEIRDITNGDGRTAKLSGNDRIGLRSTAAVFPENLQILSKQNYSLSADVYLISGDRLEIQLNPGDRQEVLAISEKGKWERVKLTANAASGFFSPNFSFIAFGSSASFYVKNVKFELGDWATAYSNYGNNKIRQKLLPDYLEKTCYEDASSATKNYSLKADAPKICSSYARKCNYNEVGCELFTNIKDNFSLPAQVVSADYCPGDCLGYDVYIAKGNYFNSAQAQNLIPDQALSCSQSDVGCSEFTNLDEVARGGEGKEYYSELRQCIKPSEAKCGNFYTWDGPNGLEIKTYSLQKDARGNPLINFNNQADGDCSDIYGLALNDPRYNPDCREFRNTSGQASYRLISGLITCSENCFSYRMAENNIDPKIKTAAQCSGSDKKWNASASVCYSCLNGGVWDDNQNACIYKAIPGQGKTCQAKQVGCKEYNGSQGDNSQLLAYYNFESGLEPWYSSCDNAASISSIANTKNGSSLFYNSGACSQSIVKLNIGAALRTAKAYSLKFLARSNNNNSLSIYLESEDNDQRYYFNSAGDVYEESVVSISGGNEWRVYNVNLENIPQDLGLGATLNISASYDFYLDDVLLTEISDRYYLVKDSINIPDICSYDNLGEYQGEDYNLGCYQYSDRSGLKHNLHNFDSLCSSASVGCEQMISTNNYSSALSGAWHDTNENGSCEDDEKNCVIVDRDEAVYAVYDQTKSCLNEDLGCSRLGEGLGSGLDITWSDVFKLNNPNNYENTFCVESDLGCEEYRNAQDGSLSYFVNPANNLCVYRPSNNKEIVGKAWYKAPVKRCDLNNSGSIDGNEGDKAICSSDSECASGTCLVDNNDYNCPVSYLKTIGYGGINSSIPIPDGSVALCDATVAGCTEYIDPVSKFNPNLVRNSSFDNNQGWGEDLWLGGPISATSQIINLERNKLYSFSKINNSDNKLVANGKLNFVNSVRVLQDNNYFSEPIKIIDLSATSTGSYVIFNSLENYSALLTGAEIGKSIEIRELVVSYNIKDQVGAGDCAGLVDFKSGCILFNERSIAGASGLKANSFNSISTIDGRSPFTTAGPYNANQLLSVRPDRTCAKWLTCTSYTIENDKSLCSSLAECNLLDDKNECANYLIRSSQESVIFDTDKNKNATGYSLPNTYYFNNIKERGLNTRARYDFEDNIPPLSCVLSDDTGKPLKGSICNPDNNINDNLVREPSTAPADYPASGKTYLKVTPGIAISPQPEGTYVLLPEVGDYYISYLVNTKNSNTSAKISIVDADTYNVITQVAATSNSAWSREVHKFSTKKKDSKVRIYLSSNKTANSSSVYFDDVNIETVLQVGDNKYAARDCRLYPTSSSLSCQETQETVVRNGVEGYCLEYDLANPGVCQLWMPIERIAAAKINTNQAGYKGKYPLSYCAEVNSNFMFLEKRVAAVVREESIRRNSSKYLGVRTCYYPGKALNYCGQMFFGETELEFVSDSSSGVSSELQVVVEYDPNNPDEGPIITVGGTHTSTTTPAGTTKISIPGNLSDIPYNSNFPLAQHYCGDSGNYFLLVTQDLKQENGIFKRDDVAITYICMPINNSDYYGYEPSSTFRYVAANSEPISTFSGVQKVHPITDGWYLADGFHNADGKAPGNKRGGSPGGFDELTNSNPPLRILDLNYPAPAGEDDLKKISSTNSDEVFRLTCNKFVEVVSGGGENMAWTQRVNTGSDYEIGSINGVNYNAYSRKIGDIPFGAASWPDNFDLTNSSRVPLYNQYSAKNKEDVYAGRPYGCAANDDNSLVNCTRIGYCSANPDVYCLLDSGLSYSGGQIVKPETKFFNSNTYDLERHSCGAWGTCQPLWTAPGGVANNVFKTTLKDYQAPLSQLFLQAPVGYEFKKNDGGYTSVAGYFTDSSAGSNPKVSGVKLYTGGKEVVGSGIKAGTHRLDFYSSVNANQQPLREIFIDWGDGFKQVITGQDSRESGQAHSFYHYYSNSRNSVVIKIKVYDNWNKSSEEFTLNK